MPKRKFSISLALACMLSAVAGVARGYYQAETCFAADQGGSYKVSKAWNSTLGTWVYTVNWNDKWTCSSGMLSMCAMCYLTLSGQYSGTTWIQLSSQTWMSSQFGCGTANNQAYGTTFPSVGVLTPGVTYSIDQYDAIWDPTKGDCSQGSSQNYESIWFYKFVCPTNP
jgi:hypothetical protein